MSWRNWGTYHGNFTNFNSTVDHWGVTGLLTKIVQTWTGSNNMIQKFNLGTSGHHITWICSRGSIFTSPIMSGHSPKSRSSSGQCPSFRLDDGIPSRIQVVLRHHTVRKEVARLKMKVFIDINLQKVQIQRAALPTLKMIKGNFKPQKLRGKKCRSGNYVSPSKLQVFGPNELLSMPWFEKFPRPSKQDGYPVLGGRLRGP